MAPQPSDSNAEPLDSTRTAPPGPATPVLWGHLQVLEKLGEGGFGEVYRAYDPSLDTDVALKFLRPERTPGAAAADRFLDEARRLARVRHPNVLVVHGVATHDGRSGIWSELVRGQTLESYLAQQGPLGAREAAAIGVDVCCALAAVHAAGLIHRDVKPGNVMREQGGRIVLMDFGSTGRLPSPGTMSQHESVHGTPLLMAPEQLAGRVAGPATDIYGVGALLYRLVTGAYPIEAGTMEELLDGHARRRSVGLRDRRPDLPPRFVHVVARALDPDPAKRPATAGEMERALLDSMTGTAESTAADRTAKPLRRILLRVALAVLAALGIWRAGILLSEHRDTGRAGGPPAKAETASPIASATIYRENASGGEGLHPGSSVNPGDRLYLDFSSDEPLHVYVLNEDERGNLFVLFPLPEVDRKNPLPAGRFRLPGSRGGRPQTWEISSVGVEEHVVVLAARAPLQALERDLSALPGASTTQPRPISEDAAIALRGIGRIADSREGGAAGSTRLSDLVEAVAGSRSVAPGVWTWQISLRNPGEASGR